MSKIAPIKLTYLAKGHSKSTQKENFKLPLIVRAFYVQ